MIAQLTGIVKHTGTAHLIIDVNGVGYLVYTSKQTIAHLTGDIVCLYVETLMKSEQLALYGFSTREEQSCFNLLITVQGVGPKMAISILSALMPAQVFGSIRTQDHMSFTQAEGVGPKLAQRIVRELKDKAGQVDTVFMPNSTASDPMRAHIRNDALSALLNLGYKRSDAEAVFNKIAEKESMTVSALITCALKKLDRSSYDY